MKNKMSYGDDYKTLPLTTIGNGVTIQVCEDVFQYTNAFVNVFFIGHSNVGDYVVVDAGVPGGAKDIIEAAQSIYGTKKPKAILLTHGHFDHVGSIIELIDYWQVQVYAHPLELPYLTGKERYPEPDPSVEGGLLAKISSLFPNEPIQIIEHVSALPEGEVPFLESFQWIHTPGHTPGHVSFFREHDRCLLVGDAFTTVRQDQLYETIVQKQEVNGPPRYFTTDWNEAEKSIVNLQKLEPLVAVTGHGVPVSGEELTSGLIALIANFKEVYKPDYGRYVE
ncbi:MULTISPECIES: MBL fold metallo-hydrolase [Shouchella]|uniref:MBL fold metallo-hydrolase n=1 Tax=Shouchella hunanensis TaxID=766894 RepID=A0ABY7W319_9BACI|nr:MULTISPECIES: MBL fold metallo-hydrolase [Shouchella]WDF03352.1 MBL fold metallo-hydrolase [Shouchella hunanensis]GAF24548.1 metallo-beta-lactamase family protein [Bacillus sp. JCM 19047]